MNSIDRKKLYQKVIWMIVPYSFIINFCNALDRTNISFGALTMNKELNITSVTFGIVTSAFFITYTFFQIPCNMLIKKFGANKIIPTIATLWGFITFLNFFAHSPIEVIILRMLLGVVEAGFFPGIMYWFTLWFPNSERAHVTSIFMLSGTIAGILGSPLAGYVVQYVDWMGFSGWRWLFLIEGLIPAIFGLFGYIIMKNGPEDAKWLSAEEKALIRSDLDAEKPVVETKTEKVGLLKVLSNAILWRIAFIYIFVQIAGQVAQLWMPTLLKGFSKGAGLSATVIGFILIVPSVTGAIAIVLNGNHSDKTGERKWHTIIPMLCVACAYLLITLPIGGLEYKIAILALYGIGSTAWYGPYWTLPASFIAPEILAVSMAVINTSSSLGGYIGNQLAGIVSAQFGSTGVFVFMACCVFASVLLVLTLDTKKIAKKTVSKA